MDPGIIRGQPAPMLHDVALNCQRISATLPPDGWNDSKSAFERELIDKSKAPSTPAPVVVNVDKQGRKVRQSWWRCLLRRRNGLSTSS
ncbi:hypothetical protein N0V86_007504 [Didymella sp. IMI 355093]|nr:hypothetical protein N0V86_007504 [Didymella sp. IMI 355093]